ncbi:MAG TPA: hypothetical protein VK797_03515 [Tepidisphaeraceae bacterium]|nr:hypothetical protein [Tepidisphaeraceae bacterium]
MSEAPPPVREVEFLALDTTDEEEIKRLFVGFIRSLHSFLNEIPCLRDVPKIRRHWKPRSTGTEAFGTFATDPRHWYTFHHGGRTEAQFNVGMFTTHLRVGLGFEFTLKKGGDPTAVQLAYACLVNVIRADQRRFEQFVTENRLEVEWTTTDGGPLIFVPTENVSRFLINLPKEPTWLFVGRLLRRRKEAAILENASSLGGLMQTILCGFRPIWERTQMLARIP